MADTGVPMLAVLWPGFVLLLIPIVIVEAAWARRQLALKWKPAIRLAAKANAISTAAGIPLAWVGMSVIGPAGHYLLIAVGLISSSENPPIVEHLLDTTLMAAWIRKGPTWYLPAATASLLVPSYFVSVWIEARVARASLPEGLRHRAWLWSWQANLLTYVPILLGLVTMACVLKFSQP